MHGDWWASYHWIMWIVWILVFVGLVAVAMKIFRNEKGLQKSGESPLDILKKRYASGEIDKNQFEEMKRDIESGQ